MVVKIVSIKTVKIEKEMELLVLEKFMLKVVGCKLEKKEFHLVLENVSIQQVLSRN